MATNKRPVTALVRACAKCLGSGCADVTCDGEWVIEDCPACGGSGEPRGAAVLTPSCERCGKALAACSCPFHKGMR